MSKKIITIDKNKCVGCGLCVSACSQGAIGMVDGKATMMHEDYCDGLGNCLPACPVNAISFSDKDISTAPRVTMPVKNIPSHTATNVPCNCASNQAKVFKRDAVSESACSTTTTATPTTELRQWPIQIKLASESAGFFEDAHLLIAADCAAYSYGNFHQEFMKNKITIIGCPKLDDVDYSIKLSAILNNNNIKSVTIVRMEVPCCGGLENATKTALKNCEKLIPWNIVTISTSGKILEA